MWFLEYYWHKNIKIIKKLNNVPHDAYKQWEQCFLFNFHYHFFIVVKKIAYINNIVPMTPINNGSNVFI